MTRSCWQDWRNKRSTVYRITFLISETTTLATSEQPQKFNACDGTQARRATRIYWFWHPRIPSGNYQTIMRLGPAISTDINRNIFIFYLAQLYRLSKDERTVEIAHPAPINTVDRSWDKSILFFQSRKSASFAVIITENLRNHREESRAT